MGPEQTMEEGDSPLQDCTSHNSPRASQGTANSHQASKSPVGKVVAFPGHRPTEAELRSILSILANTGPISVRHLKMEAGLTEGLLTRCVERLADAGLLTAEDRKDSNTLRLIVSATDAGRRVLAACIEGNSVSGESPERGETG